MDETNEQKEQTVQKYLLLMNMICAMENRLVRSEMVYLIINIIIFFSSTLSQSGEIFRIPLSSVLVCYRYVRVCILDCIRNEVTT